MGLIVKGRTLTLDALRGFFAFYIVLHHLALYQYHEALFFVTGQGQVVVICFIILSGINQELFSSKSKQSSAIKFLKKKFLRIYPAFLFSLLLTYILASFKSGNLVTPDWQTIGGHILNLQDLDNRYPNVWFNTYKANTPLWFVSYIWWSYIIYFGIVKLARREVQLLIAVMISVFGFLSFQTYPNTLSHILSYFLIWWSGVSIARIKANQQLIDFKPLVNLLLALSIMLMLNLLVVWTYDGTLIFHKYPIIETRHYLYAIIAIIIGVCWVKLEKPLMNGMKYFVVLAPISYEVFLFHYPLIISSNPFDTGLLGLDYLLSFLLTITLAFVVKNDTKKMNLTN